MLQTEVPDLLATDAVLTDGSSTSLAKQAEAAGAKILMMTGSPDRPLRAVAPRRKLDPPRRAAPPGHRIFSCHTPHRCLPSIFCASSIVIINVIGSITEGRKPQCS
jgi:hypothetical protein